MGSGKVVANYSVTRKKGPMRSAKLQATKRRSPSLEKPMKTQTSNNIKYQSSLYPAIVGLISIGLTAALAIGVTNAGAQLPPIRPYTVTDLGTLPAKKANVSLPAAINEQGQV